VQALIGVPGGLVSAAATAEETGLVEAVAETVVETTAPTVLGGLARLAALLPELAAAAIVAVFVPTNSRDDPGYKPEWDIIWRNAAINATVTDKDRAELAYLEQRHQDGTLSAAEEQQLPLSYSLACAGCMCRLYMVRCHLAFQMLRHVLGLERS
jgi:hypothetical protein